MKRTKRGSNIKRARFKSALDAYLWHGYIGGAEYKAGLKFNREYSRAIYRLSVSEGAAGSRGDYEMQALSFINSTELLAQISDLLSQR